MTSEGHVRPWQKKQTCNNWWAFWGHFSPPLLFLQALKRQECPKEARVGLKSVLGVGLTTHPTDCLQVHWPTPLTFGLSRYLRDCVWVQIGGSDSLFSPLIFQQTTRWWSCRTSRRASGLIRRWRPPLSQSSPCWGHFRYCSCCTESTWKDCCWQTFSSGTTMKTVCGDETTDWKRQVSRAQCWPQGRILKLAKHKRTRLHQVCRAALSVWGKVCVLCLLFQKMTVFSSRNALRALWFFRALSWRMRLFD